MDIAATQLLYNDDDNGAHNLANQQPESHKRVRQVASLCVENKKYPIFEGINTVGRNPSCDVVLINSTVSKNHAEIEAHAKSAFICDLGSSNKTRLNNDILRPERFYQVSDGTQLKFGIMNAQYWFLRDLDNSIIIPETPTPGPKIRDNYADCSLKNCINSSFNDNDENSIIAATQSSNNNDEVFAMPTPRSRQSRIHNRSTAVQIKPRKINIHDVPSQQHEQSANNGVSLHIHQTQKMSERKISDVDNNKNIHEIETQQFENESMKSSENIHEIATQNYNDCDNSSDMNDIHTMQTPKRVQKEKTQLDISKKPVRNVSLGKCHSANPFKNTRTSIHDLETQKFDVKQNNPDTAKSNALPIGNNDCDDNDISVVETQEFSSNAKIETLGSNIRKNQSKGGGDTGLNENVGNEVDEDAINNSPLSTAVINNETVSNTMNTHIIRETDDESETDEEGIFSNIQINNNKNVESIKQSNVIDDTDSETDQDGEFESLRPSCSKNSVDSNKVISNVRNDHNLHKNINQELINTRNPDNFESQCLSERVTCQSPILTNLEQSNSKYIENTIEDTNDNPSLPLTQVLKINQQDEIASSIKNNEIINSDVDDDDSPTQCLEKLKTKSLNQNSLQKNLIADNDYDDMALTQRVEMLSEKKAAQKIPVENVNNNNNDDDDDDDDMAPTQIMPISENEAIIEQTPNNNEFVNDKESSCNNIPKVESEKNVEIEDDATQIIQKNPDIVKNDCSENADYFDDTTPTQIIKIQPTTIQTRKRTKAVKIGITDSKSIAGRRKSINSESDKDEIANCNSHKHKSPEKVKSKISLRLQRKNNASTQSVDESPKTSENLNDSVSTSLAKLFGDENEEHQLLNIQTPMATQQLQDVLENNDNRVNKQITKFKRKHKLNSLSSDTDSQDSFFSNLHSHRKCNVIHSSQDSTELEDEANSSPSSKRLNLKIGVSGFKEGVAVDSKELLQVNESTPEEHQRDSTSKNKKVPKLESATVANNEAHEFEQKKDILENLPEVRIYGTSSYPASPSSSICSLDDWEPFERKRIEKLRASTSKNLSTTNKTSSKVSSENTEKIDVKKPSDVNKILGSSDDELDFEDLKKMATSFIANDMKTKILSVKLEKISDVGNIQFKNNEIEPKSIAPMTKRQVPLRKYTRTRAKKISNATLSLQNLSSDSSKSIEDPPSQKVQNLHEKSINNSSSSNSNTGIESQEVQMIQKESITEIKKPVRKVSEKRKYSMNLLNNQQTPLKVKRTKISAINSPAVSTHSRIQHKVLFTGLQHSNYEADIKKCGGTVIEKPDCATILVTDKIRRTTKFFCALSRHIPIVSEKWIQDSGKIGHFLDWTNYILKDPVTEAKYSFKLQQSLERASKKKLLDGFTCIVTSNVKNPSMNEVKDMVQRSGGKVLVRSPKLWLPNTFIISCLEDILKVQNLLSKVPKQLEIPVFSVEFILLGILKQELNFNDNRIKVRDCS